MPLPTGARLGPYEVLSAIGAGGMGEVYKARDTRLHRIVAIKVLPAEFAVDAERLKRFEREAEATAALSHPNILAVYDVGTCDGVPYLVEELLEGESLRDRLRGGALPVGEATGIAIQIAHGLAAAHEKHIIHRDLKPANVFLTIAGAVKILDFGLAKLVEGVPVEDADTVSVAPAGATEVGRVLGTMAYMAPEQARGLRVDARADLFAFGVVLYEMLAGERPFRGATATATIAAILTDDPPPLPNRVPPALQRVVSQCVEKSPERRFSSAHDLALALEAASSAGEAASTVVAGAGATTPARRRSLRLVGGLLLVATVAAAASALVVWRPWHAAAESATRAADRIPSVLALPCKVYGAADVAFLTDAVPGTISTLLSGIEGLDTKVPPSSFEVEKVKGDLAKLAVLYQVSSFIVTSITASPGRFALNVQLVDATTRKARWGQQYEGPRDAYNDLARQAAEGLRQAVKPTARPVPSSGLSSETELAFREGTYYFDRFANLGHSADFDAALSALTRALALDPSFGIAAGKVAQLFTGRFTVEGDVHDARRQAESWARRALGIDPRCGEAWAALGQLEMLSTRADLDRATDYALKGANFAPRDAFAHAILAVPMNSSSLGLAAALRALELDPFLVAPATSAAWCLVMLGRPHDALVLLDRTFMVEPDWQWGLIVKGWVLTRLGRLEEAESTLRRCEHAASGTHIVGGMWRDARFALAVAQRDTAMSRTLAQEILAADLDSRADALLVGNSMSVVVPSLAHIGRTDDAIRLLQRSVEVGFIPNLDGLLIDPDIQLLRGDPRFAGILKASRDGAVLDVRILGQARARGELPKYLEPPLDDLVKLVNANGPKR